VLRPLSLDTGGKKRVYFIALIDDASRFIIAADIFFNDNFENLMAVIRSAVSKYGRPRLFSFDNSPSFRRKQKVLMIPMAPYKAAYCSMPSHAEANPAIQRMYINGHFCYAYKFGVVTIGLGIIHDITFYHQEFLKAHTDIIVEKKSDSPNEDKSLADSKALIPVPKDFVTKHPLINPKAFLGDSAFDTIQIYHDLFHELKFQTAYIPLNNRFSLYDADCLLNERGILYCPHDPVDS